MPSVQFRDSSGTLRSAVGDVGESAMRVAVRCGVVGILARCGGAASCGTCHVYIDPAWAARIDRPDALEDDLLEATAAPRRTTSRLSCQVVLSNDLDGLVIDVPDVQ